MRKILKSTYAVYSVSMRSKQFPKRQTYMFECFSVNKRKQDMKISKELREMHMTLWFRAIKRLKQRTSMGSSG